MNTMQASEKIGSGLESLMRELEKSMGGFSSSPVEDTNSIEVTSEHGSSGALSIETTPSLVSSTHEDALEESNHGFFSKRRYYSNFQSNQREDEISESNKSNEELNDNLDGLESPKSIPMSNPMATQNYCDPPKKRKRTNYKGKYVIKFYIDNILIYIFRS